MDSERGLFHSNQSDADIAADYDQAFLSMPFFDWRPGAEAAAVSSPFVWVYWVITLPLTGMLFVGWRAWARREEAKPWFGDEAKKEVQEAAAINRPICQRLLVPHPNLLFEQLRPTSSMTFTLLQPSPPMRPTNSFYAK